ncbi:MAG: pilus assembly PilX N-terminal domain-containing protein [Desulfobacterales bacterium]|nr:MAG: pilus assembly PilX N-terminal domain-containing protein [Desulfobacterales bacterium]
MLPTTFHRRKEDGYIIIAALLILALLTIICVSASNMSMTEMKIATNELLYERAFYAAESGLQHLTELLRIQYVDNNSAILSSGGTSNWSFALQGAVDSDDDGVGDFAGGVTLLNRNLDNINLQVRVWNNDDGGGPANDTDGLIYVHSEAGGPRGALCRIEMLLEGKISGTAISDYIAQEGAGPGKNFVSDDADAMEDFTQTDLPVE